jgi:chitin disaccharide deacetylase
MQSRSKRLIVNADDFGMSRGITDGILRAHQDGIVTSTSIMVNMPGSEYAIQRMREFPSLGVGVHLNLCEGRPLLPPHKVSTLITKDGVFHPLSEMIHRMWHWQLSEREIEAEFRAQIQWMKERGATPTHADSHQHMYTYPPAAIAFRRALKAERVLKIRGTVTRAGQRGGSIRQTYGGALPRQVAVRGYMEFLQNVVFHGFIYPDSSLAIPRTYRDRGALGEGVRFVLNHVPSGTYQLGCHPGIAPDDAAEADDFKGRRECDLQLFTDPELRKEVERNQIALINYRELGFENGRNRRPV